VELTVKETQIPCFTYTTLQILSVNNFDRILLLQAFGNCTCENGILPNTNQLSLYD